MEKTNRKKLEKELQKALAISYVMDFCEKNRLSLEKLKMQRFILSCNECAFAQPSNVKPHDLTNDRDTMPKVTLIITLEEGQLKIKETEYTKEFLAVE